MSDLDNKEANGLIEIVLGVACSVALAAGVLAVKAASEVGDWFSDDPSAESIEPSEPTATLPPTTP
ncbi:MAG TPA: hypothetical protein VK674_02425 [Candidatus Limnocylindria bacterium]|nr:hypothetical protein [Candidatus Limnocylindria bacterium]